MEFVVQSKEVENFIIENLIEYFKDKVADFTVKESADIPYLQLKIECSFYNFYVIRFLVEKGTLFISISQSKYQFDLMKLTFKSELFYKVLEDLESELQLRIPDKYLSAKGWS